MPTFAEELNPPLLLVEEPLVDAEDMEEECSWVDDGMVDTESGHPESGRFEVGTGELVVSLGTR